MKPGRSSEITLLRSVLPILVVLIHSNILFHVDFDAEQLGVFSRGVELFYVTVVSMAVPCFYAVSGFLFFTGFALTISGLRRKLSRRVLSLVVPYLLWNILGMALFLVKGSAVLGDYFSQYQSGTLTFAELIEGFWNLPGTDGPYDMPLWFVRNLIVVQLFSPLVWLLVKVFRQGAIVVAYVVAVALSMWVFPPGVGYSFVVSFFYFICGAVLALHYHAVVMSSARVAAWTVAYVGLTALFQWQPIEAMHYARELVGVVMIFKWAAWMTRRGMAAPRIMEESAFFVYAFHGLFISVTARVVCRLIPPGNGVVATLDYVLTFAVLYLLSVGCYAVMRQVAPGFTRLICGKVTLRRVE